MIRPEFGPLRGNCPMGHTQAIPASLPALSCSHFGHKATTVVTVARAPFAKEMKGEVVPRVAKFMSMPLAQPAHSNRPLAPAAPWKRSRCKLSSGSNDRRRILCGPGIGSVSDACCWSARCMVCRCKHVRRCFCTSWMQRVNRA